MVKILRYIAAALTCAAFMAVASCSSDEPSPYPAPEGLNTYTCRMVLRSDDDSRATKQFLPGDSVIIYFKTTSGSFTGFAKLENSGDWTLTYKGSQALVADNRGTANVAFCRNGGLAVNETSSVVASNKPIYGTDAAEWYYNANGTLEMLATLKPLNIMVVFTSSSQKTIMSKGLQPYSLINMSNMKLGIPILNYDAIMRPCFPITININKENNGTYESEPIYVAALGNNHYRNSTCTHGTADCPAATLMLYDIADNEHYYSRNIDDINSVTAGDYLKIAVPENESEKWTRVDNIISTSLQNLTISACSSWRFDVSILSGQALNFHVEKTNRKNCYMLIQHYQTKETIFKLGWVEGLISHNYSAIAVNTSGSTTSLKCVFYYSIYDLSDFTVSEFPLYETRIDE